MAGHSNASLDASVLEYPGPETCLFVLLAWCLSCSGGSPTYNTTRSGTSYPILRTHPCEDPAFEVRKTGAKSEFPVFATPYGGHKSCTAHPRGRLKFTPHVVFLDLLFNESQTHGLLQGLEAPRVTSRTPGQTITPWPIFWGSGFFRWESGGGTPPSG